MTPQRLTIVRRHWKESGLLSCSHPILIPLRDRERNLTGIYVCTRCGDEVINNNSDSSQDEK
jgi:hypothetical protein